MDNPPQLNGVVIITLPPVNNPSKGKTITSIFTYSEQQPNNNNNNPSLSPPPQTQHHFSFKTLFNTPRRALGLLSISLVALLMLTSLTSSNTFYELRNSDGDDDQEGVDSFVFDLYRKGVQKDVEFKLGRVVRKDAVSDVMMMADDGVEAKEISKVGSLMSSSSSAVADSSTIFSVRGDVYPYGLYYVSLLVGNPPRPYHLDMDTGSDLTWIQCDAPCSSCAKGPHPLYKPTKGTVVSSKDSLCKELQGNQKHGDCESCQQCDYEIEYADRSSSIGVLARDKMQLMISNGTLLNPSFVFGCAYDQQGQLSISPAKTDGILGLNGAKVSLPSQLASQGIIHNLVGHCISHDNDNHGYMFLGDDFLPKWGMTWIPMLSSPSINSYHAEIVKITYGSEVLSLGRLENSVVRVVFDSGSSYTYFSKDAYSDLVASLKIFSDEGLIRDKSDPTLPLCWRAGFPIRSLKDVEMYFRPLTLHFGSKWWIMSRKISISLEGYLIISNKGNVCLGILDGSDVHDGSTIILGDISLRGQLVAYDNVNQKIGWMKSNCAKPQRYESLPFFF